MHAKGQFHISIALCTFNGAEFILEQLASLIRQTRPPDEIIVSDDHSTDRTVELIANFAEQSKVPIRMFANPCNLGFARNFEKAISFCKGDIIALCDQDDMWLPEKLSVIEKEFKKDHFTGGVFSNAIVVNKCLKPLGYTIWDVVGLSSKKSQAINEGKALDVLLQQTVVTGATFAFRTSLLKYILPIPTTWQHDAWISFIISYYSTLKILPVSLILYRQHSYNQIGGIKQRKIDQLAKAIRTDRRQYYLDEIERLLDFLRRIRKNHDTCDKKNRIIYEKVDHLINRYSYPRCRILRIPFIFKGIASNKYGRFTRGYQVIIKDLLMP